MEGKITGKDLKAALGTDIDRLLEEVAEVMNQAQPGRIIADSEEGVHDAAGEFRQRLYQMALKLRQQQAGAFSPSAGDAQQGAAEHDLHDDQRAGGDPPPRVLESRRRKRRAR
jgi:hypothetical protein